MSALLPVEERVLEHLIQTSKDEHTQQVFLALNTYGELDEISPQEYTDALQSLQTKDYISIYWYGGHIGAGTACRVTLRAPAFEYYKGKQENNQSIIIKQDLQSNQNKELSVIKQILIGVVVGVIVLFISVILNSFGIINIY